MVIIDGILTGLPAPATFSKNLFRVEHQFVHLIDNHHMPL